MAITFSRDQCLNLETSLKQEWLDTNGLGGYASSTILNCHTRKYHGLLVAALQKPAGRYVLLSKLELSLQAGENEFHLSTNKYPGVYYPTGHKYVESFEYELIPVTTYGIGDIRLRQSIMMVRGENTVLVKLELLDSRNPVILTARPLLAYRGLHNLMRQNMYLHGQTLHSGKRHTIEPYDEMPPLHLDWSAPAVFHPGPYWCNNVEYLKELSRGYDYQEDLFCPGVFQRELHAGDSLVFRASVDSSRIPPGKAWDTEFKSRTRRAAVFSREPGDLGLLKLHSEKFLIDNGTQGASVIAGYHWFDAWGRDTMISLPGLTLSCGRTETCLNVLAAWARLEKEGLLPNIAGSGIHDSAYNSVDTSLWFFWAIQEYLAATGDMAGIQRHLWEAMTSILFHWLDGKTPLVCVMPNGLVWTGTPDTQLTWMDATSGGRPVTPRHGMAVEINALWYNALCFHLQLCRKLKLKPSRKVEECRALVEKHFSPVFWVNDGEYLADVVNDAGQDASVRPNQIFAVSLPFSCLPRNQMVAVVQRVKSELTTPFGLRTLSPQSAAYQPFYEGNQDARDAAYHQGTTWAWLIGHFADACLKTAREPEVEKQYLARLFEPLWTTHLREFGLYGVSEIFNGNPPHKAKGCIDQAWSVAETIRLLERLKG